MIDINLVSCSLNCIYQKDGNCTLNDGIPITLDQSADCSYYSRKTNNQNSSSKEKSQQKS